MLVDTARKDFHGRGDTAIANAACLAGNGLPWSVYGNCPGQWNNPIPASATQTFLSRRSVFVVVCRSYMDAELAKLVEAGKLTPKASEQLDQLKPGTFCLHKSWGFGRIADWNLLLNQILIDFPGKKGHPMQLQYAADNLTLIPPDHFLARKAADPQGTKKLAKEDPASLVKNILESLGGKAIPQQISEWMVPDLFTEAEWKRWWESAKRTLKKDGHFMIPAKKNEPVELRAAPVAQADEMLLAFNRARQPKEQTAAMEQIVKLYSEFPNPAVQLQPVVVALEQAAVRNQKLHPGLTF